MKLLPFFCCCWWWWGQICLNLLASRAAKFLGKRISQRLLSSPLRWIQLYDRWWAQSPSHISNINLHNSSHCPKHNNINTNKQLICLSILLHFSPQVCFSVTISHIHILVPFNLLGLSCFVL